MNFGLYLTGNNHIFIKIQLSEKLISARLCCIMTTVRRGVLNFENSYKIQIWSDFKNSFCYQFELHLQHLMKEVFSKKNSTTISIIWFMDNIVQTCIWLIVFQVLKDELSNFE
jgi:hypothetical protein